MTDSTPVLKACTSPDFLSQNTPEIGFEDKHELNRQTAFNKSRLINSDVCGCFYCRRIFATERIREWMQEEAEEETGVCPFCDTDALVTGTDAFPLSAGLLKQLYQEWFSEEYKEKQKTAIGLLQLFEEEDVFRETLTDVDEKDKKVLEVGKIRLVSTRLLQNEEGGLHNKESYQRALEELMNERTGGIVSVKVWRNDKGRYCSEIIDAQGKPIPYALGGKDDYYLAYKLTKQYGDKLMGVTEVTFGGYGKTMYLYIEH